MRDIANSGRSSDALLFNVYRNREKTEPRTFEPIPAPERKRTPEQQAADEQRRLEEQRQQQIEEHSAVITHDIGMQLLTGQMTMDDLAWRIRAKRGIE
ncbi:hypothetical protein [Nocardia tengchongensis]|uniref:hypothetical protein n=1 Tax=Nocardia tengchongensis TaxID=2055889 RepID=UPI0036CD57C2